MTAMIRSKTVLRRAIEQGGRIVRTNSTWHLERANGRRIRIAPTLVAQLKQQSI